MKKMWTLQDIVNSSWGETFKETWGENLTSAFLHGNCLYEGFDAVHSPWQISVFLKTVDAKSLSLVHKLTRKMSADNLKFGFFLSEEFVRKNQTNYPLEFLHISQKNVPIFGEAPLQNFTPDEASLRNECRRELCGRKLQLLREFTRIQAGISPMDFFIEAHDEILPVLYGVYFVRKGCYPQNRDEVLELFPEFRIQEPALDYAQNVERADAYFAAIENLIQGLE